MKLSRVDVLAAIAAAGPNGIKKNALVAKFDHLVPENSITSHLVQLKKDGAIDNPSLGRWVAIDGSEGVSYPAKPVAEAKARPAASPIAELKQDRAATAKADLKKALDQHVSYLMPAMPELAVREETIEITDIQDRRAPVVIDSPDNTVFGMFSSGEMEITDSFHSFKLTAPVVAKMRGFLGLFAEVA